MDMVSAGILGLAFIALIVFCVLAAKTWHWVNIVFVILTFMAGVGAIWGLTQVYHLRTKAIADVDAAEKKLVRVKKDADEAIYGDLNSTTYEAGSLRYMDGVLAREFAGRGRVWTRGQVANGAFTFSTPRPADFEPLKDVVLFAFLELPVTEQSKQLYPSRFIGSVRVSEETAGSVTLSPVALADAQQFAQPTSTWSLFEKMPLDRRGTFKKATITLAENPNAPDDFKAFAAQLAEGNDFDIGVFRNVLRTRFLKPEIVGLAEDSAEYEALIDRYAFDGLSLGTIQNWIDQNSTGRKSLRFEPKPGEVFVNYEFVEASKKEGGYQVDSTGSIETEGQYNRLGHAISPALKAGGGGAISFSKGDTVLVDKLSADGYQRGPDQQIPAFADGENVKVVDQGIYIRQVRDYPYEFVDLTLRSNKVAEAIQRVRQNNEIQDKLLADAEAQYDERLRVTSDEESDQSNLKNDYDAAVAAVRVKTQQVAQLKQSNASLESQIQATYTQLRDLSIRLSRQAFARR